MDERCLRKLEDTPDKFCALAVLRLKAIRNAGRELTEEEEASLPGCPWAIQNQTSNYCFFKYVEDMPDTQLSDIEVAHMLGISVESVKKTERKAIAKLKVSKDFVEIAATYDGDQIIQDSPDLV